MSEEKINVEFLSLEIRWFLTKPVPLEIKEIFNDVRIETRTDIYWTQKMRFNPPITNEGIKLREGGFEVKTLLQNIYQSEIPGKVQKWKKSRKPIPSNIDLSEDWVKVLKNRQLLIYKVTPDLEILPVSYMPKQGAHVELTSFGEPFEDKWTFGIEAYGRDADLQDNLVRVYQKCLDMCQHLKGILKLDTSNSYPEWLATYQ